MKRLQLTRSNLMESLKIAQSILLVVMLIMFINFNAKVAEQTAQTQAIALSTNNVVKSQADILAAIKQVTDDTHTTAAQQTSIIICMLQVPIASRTTDLQSQCRAASGATGTYSASGTTQNSTDTTAPVSSSNGTPASTPAQSNSSQPTSKPSFLDRVVVNPIKSIINAL